MFNGKFLVFPEKGGFSVHGFTVEGRWSLAWQEEILWDRDVLPIEALEVIHVSTSKALHKYTIFVNTGSPTVKQVFTEVDLDRYKYLSDYTLVDILSFDEYSL